MKTEAGTGRILPPWHHRRERSPADTWLSDFQLPELRDDVSIILSHQMCDNLLNSLRKLPWAWPAAQMLGGGWPPHVSLWLHKGLTPLAQTLKKLPWPPAQSANLAAHISLCFLPYSWVASLPGHQAPPPPSPGLGHTPLPTPTSGKWTLTSLLAPLGQELLLLFRCQSPSTQQRA